MNRLKVIGYNILIFCLLFLFFEIITNVLRPNYLFFERTYPGQYEDRSYSDASWLRKHSKFGWVSRSNQNLQFSNKHYRNRAEIYQINPQGFRCKYDLDSLPVKQKKRILLLGDSYLFSIYLPEHQSFSSILETHLGNEYEIFNLGIPGWGIDQMYLSYEQYANVISPDEVILVFVDDDVYRCVQAFRSGEDMNKPSFKAFSERLNLRGERDEKPGFVGWLCSKSSILNRFYRIYWHSIGKDISERIFSKMNNNDYPLSMILRIPVLEDFKRGQPYGQGFEGFCENYDIPYLDPYDFMNDLPLEVVRDFYLKEDTHLSPLGVQYMVKVLLEKRAKL